MFKKIHAGVILIFLSAGAVYSSARNVDRDALKSKNLFNNSTRNFDAKIGDPCDFKKYKEIKESMLKGIFDADNLEEVINGTVFPYIYAVDNSPNPFKTAEEICDSHQTILECSSEGKCQCFSTNCYGSVEKEGKCLVPLGQGCIPGSPFFAGCVGGVECSEGVCGGKPDAKLLDSCSPKLKDNQTSAFRTFMEDRLAIMEKLM